MNLWESRTRSLAGRDRPRIMGIINVTPDSFSDGGLTFDGERAVCRGRQLIAEGADLLDIGGESSRPGALPIPAEEEIRRTLPVIEALAGDGRVPISIDTTKALVARSALEAGAAIVNDITALQGDPALCGVVRDYDAAVVLMHMQGEPRTMQLNPQYQNVVEEVYDFLARRVEWAAAQGIPHHRIALDPGIGFGKTTAHNLLLLQNLRRFESLGCAILVGTSRKRFLGELTGRDAAARTAASIGSALAAIAGGANIVRVHDVGPTSDALKVWLAQTDRDFDGTRTGPGSRDR